MSIKKSDVQVKRNLGKNHYTFEAQLVLKNENVVNKDKMSLHEIEEATEILFDNLQMSIIAHIYGDLIEPINTIVRIVNQDIILKKDKEKVYAVRQQIQDILFGNETKEEINEAKKKSVIQLLN